MIIAVLLSVTLLGFWSEGMERTAREYRERKATRRVTGLSNTIATLVEDELPTQPHCPLFGWHAADETPGTRSGCYVLREARCVQAWGTPTQEMGHTCEVYKLTRKIFVE